MIRLFEPAAGPALRDGADGCAFERVGRVWTRRCHATTTTHEAVSPADEMFGLCAHHAVVWSGTVAVDLGIYEVRERVTA